MRHNYRLLSNSLVIFISGVFTSHLPETLWFFNAFNSCFWIIVGFIHQKKERKKIRYSPKCFGYFVCVYSVFSYSQFGFKWKTRKCNKLKTNLGIKLFTMQFIHHGTGWLTVSSTELKKLYTIVFSILMNATLWVDYAVDQF